MIMTDEFSFKFELLKREMDAVQSGIRTYGQVQFTIKGWAITLFSGFIFFAAKEKQPIFLGLCALAVILFWILDVVFKSIQKVYIDRAVEIETWLHGVKFASDQDPLQGLTIPNIDTKFEQLNARDKLKNFLRAGLTLQLSLFYFVMLIVVVVVAVSKPWIVQ
jgi:hypothetical protein